MKLKTSPAERLRHIMQITGFSSDYAMERATGVPRSTIKNILTRDRIGPKSARKIAEALNLSMAWVESGFGPIPEAPKERSETKEELAREEVGMCTVIDPWSAGEHLLDDFEEQGKTNRTSVRVRLRSVMEAFGLDTGIALAHACGITGEALDEISAKDEIDDETAAYIVKRVGVAFDWLRHGKGPMQKEGSEIEGFKGEPSDQAAEKLIPPVEAEKQSDRIRGAGPAFSMVPKATAKLSAGGGIIPEEGTTGEEYAFRLDWLKQVATSTKNVILIDVDGDSMAPTLLDKDTVLIDRGRTELRGGRIYAIAIGDVVQIKRLQWLTPERIRVIADNPAYYTHEIHPNDMRIIGQMIWSARTWV